MGSMKAALWLRVSDPSKQTTDNQLEPLEHAALVRQLDVVKIYDVGASAYRGDHNKALGQVYKDARANRFKTLIIWSLDRLSRQGVGAICGIVKKLDDLGVTIVSIQETWLEQDGMHRDLLIAVLGWAAEFESKQRGDRTKAGLERRKRAGHRLGRPQGSKDKRKRRTAGYRRVA